MSEAAEVDDHRTKEVAPRTNRIFKKKKGSVTVAGVGARGANERTLAPAHHPGVAPKHGPSARGPPSAAAKFITTTQLRERWGNVSHMFIERRVKGDPNFPKPIFFGRLRFWDVEEVAAWERAQILKSRDAA
jgi:hypothetical protein